MIRQIQQENQLRFEGTIHLDTTLKEKEILNINSTNSSIFSLWRNKIKNETQKIPISKTQNFKDRGVQTNTREEYTQTIPYSPQEIITENTDMELLKIKHFKWGENLPPTIDELEYIDDLREKTAFEGALPPLSDEACFGLRRKLMQHQEIKEWGNKENEIKRHQINKLKLLENILVEREKEIQAKENEELQKLRRKKVAEKNIIIAKIQKKKQKILRKLIKIQNEFIKGKNQDKITQYNDYSSKIYANITREGICLENLSENFKKNPYALNNYEMYKELLHSIEPSKIEIQISLDQLLQNSKRKYLKLEKYHIQQLKKAQEEQKGFNSECKNTLDNEKYNLNIQNVKPRPLTPYYEHKKELQNYPHQEVNLDKNKIPEVEQNIYKQEQKHQAAMLIQKLLRGRAIQNSMFDGKEKRLALIEELLIVANINHLEKEKEDEIIKKFKEKQQKQAFLESIKGQVIVYSTDILAKELIRQQDQQKINSFVNEVEKERNNLEAIETGRRQAEITIKQREEQLYTQLLNVNRNYVENLLDETVDYSCSFLTKKIALEDTKLRDIKFQEYLKNHNENYDIIVEDFVRQFLIPNVNKQKLRKKIQIEEKKISQLVKEKINQQILYYQQNKIIFNHIFQLINFKNISSVTCF